MIDMNSSDMTCFYSKLLYVSSHARHYGVTPILIFDQPLWWKALTIQESTPAGSEIRSIILRLGESQTEMSFLGCIGHIMAGTGLQELQECINANNAVDHMLSEKAISRAVHGHLLISGALNTMFMSEVFGIPLPHTEASQKGSGQENTSAEESSHKTDQSTTPESDQTVSEQMNVLPIPEVLIVAGTLYDDLMAGSITI